MATTAADTLAALALCGILGMAGQGVRAVVGLKNANSLGSTTPSQQTGFNAAYFVLSLMIGFIAGVLAGLAIGLSKFASIDLDHPELLLGVAASGYAGADFIENSMSIVIPHTATQPAQPAPAQPAQPAAPPLAPAAPLAPALAAAPAAGGAVAAVAAPAAGAVSLASLTAALHTVAPQLNVAEWAPALVAGFAEFEINNNRRIAVAIGQFLVEAGPAFQEVVENLRYTHAERIHQIFPHQFPTIESAQPFVNNPQALANRVYANRLGNGDEASGDGFRFRGRGLIQLTGRDEYSDFADATGKTLDETVQFCETREGAATSGCWYLKTRGCLPFADAWAISRVTRIVNGPGMVGNADRIAYANAMLQALGGSGGLIA